MPMQNAWYVTGHVKTIHIGTKLHAIKQKVISQHWAGVEHMDGGGGGRGRNCSPPPSLFENRGATLCIV